MEQILGFCLTLLLINFFIQNDTSLSAYISLLINHACFYSGCLHFREMKSGLFNRVKSLVPSRSYLALKGYAFHEYLSSLGCILRSESFRLTESSNNTKKRRYALVISAWYSVTF